MKFSLTQLCAVLHLFSNERSGVFLESERIMFSVASPFSPLQTYLDAMTAALKHVICSVDHAYHVLCFSHLAAWAPFRHAVYLIWTVSG